jgi:hypothetical protein
MTAEDTEGTEFKLTTEITEKAEKEEFNHRWTQINTEGEDSPFS